MNPAINYFDFERRLSLVDNNKRTIITNEYVWGLSVVKIGDTYHAYIERWIDDDNISGYVYYSKIYHATSSDPLGPYSTMDELPELQAIPSNAGAAFNPYAVVHNGFVYLFYAATTDETPEYPLIGTDARNNNRIFLAKAPVDDPGNFTLIGSGPILGPDTGQLLVNNPAFYWDVDGNAKMVYKYSTIENETGRIFAIASANNIEGPWINASAPISGISDVEDGCVWKEGEFFFMICKDEGSGLVDFENGILLYSKTGYADDWHVVSDRTRAYRLTTVNDINTSEIRTRIERPFVLAVDGVAVAFFTACMAIGGLSSFNVGRAIRT